MEGKWLQKNISYVEIFLSVNSLYYLLLSKPGYTLGNLCEKNTLPEQTQNSLIRNQKKKNKSSSFLIFAFCRIAQEFIFGAQMVNWYFFLCVWKNKDLLWNQVSQLSTARRLLFFQPFFQCNISSNEVTFLIKLRI